ncbi:MAG: tRNA pseudouridine(55) synthase TruB [Hyphomicrobiales bacterium]
MARRRKGNPVHGWLILDKPLEMTSTKAVAIVKRLFNAQKAGHAGTLDPLATGLLAIAFGEATKTVSFAMDGQKVYRFTARWGIETQTDDGEGDACQTSDNRPSNEEIEAILSDFTGEIMQVPPAFSAIKVAGERAYDLARGGKEVSLDPRAVQIDDLRLVETPDDDHAVFEAECGKGTYVRALARDMGRKLGCFGHVCTLRRARVGPFGERDMISLEKLEEMSHKGAGQEAIEELLFPVATVLDDIPALAVEGQEAARLRSGQAIIARGRDAPILHGTVVVTAHGEPVAIAEIREGMVHPRRVFNLT